MSWLLKPEVACCDLTLSRSLFHSTGAAVAKSRLSMAFLRQTEDTNGLFSHVRLLDLIRDDKQGVGRNVCVNK